jgi:hypothetical protein
VRKQHWPLTLLIVLSLLMTAACSDSSPTRPTAPDTPALSISFALASPGTLSLSEPIPCSADKDPAACPPGLQPQGAATGSRVRTEQYTLRPGTYLLTGRVQGTSPLSAASVRIAFGRGASAPSGGGGGVDKSWGGTIFIGPSGGPSPAVPPSVLDDTCVKTFTNGAGAVEWGVIFHVLATAESEQLCR